jgi:hemerythrin superfamily protein
LFLGKALGNLERIAMNFFEMLHKDHEKVAELFARLEAMGSSEGGLREQVIQTLAHEMDVHRQAEEKYLYSRLKGEEETRELILESLDDHKDLGKALEELETMEKGTPDWWGKLRACRALVHDHVAQEENDLFPRARRLLGEDEIAALSEDIATFKDEHAELEAY